MRQQILRTPAVGSGAARLEPTYMVRLAELDADAELYVVCHVGGRSQRVAQYLARNGFRPVNVTGGMLATFSCSGGIDAALFLKIVAGAALDANADAAVIGRFGASADHPVELAFPEGEYMKGLLVRKAG